MTDEAQPELVLASASPRRRQLLGYLGVRFEAIATQGEERQSEVAASVLAELPAFPLDLRFHPTLLAWRKGDAAREEGYTGLILAADTIVVLDGDVLNKPRDEADAQRMLRLLAGRTHTVYTGVALFDVVPGRGCSFELVRSDVTMAPLTDDEIAGYVATGEPLDKAGAYGIQGLGGRLVQGVAGSYTNVVGLPLTTVHRLLEVAGLRGLIDPADAFRRWLADQGKEAPGCITP